MGWGEITEYDVYEDGRFAFRGTATEIGDRFGMTAKLVRWKSTPSARRKRKHNYMVRGIDVVKADDDAIDTHATKAEAGKHAVKCKIADATAVIVGDLPIYCPFCMSRISFDGGANEM